MPIDQIRNALVVNERIGTGGQPTESQLRELAAAGYRLVVNLGLLDPKYCLPDEAGAAKALGIEYEHIPVKFDAPAPEQFAKFVSAMDACVGQRVFVHCAANYRVSAFMALYGELRLGWTRAQADAHIRKVWEPNATWSRFVDEVRATFDDPMAIIADE